MPMSNYLAAYEGIAVVLDAAKEHGGGTYRLETKGKARNWRQRAYYYRKLLREHQQRVGVAQPTTPYDTMRIEQDGETLRIMFDLDIGGELTDLTGKPIKPRIAGVKKKPDELEEAASAAIGELNIDTEQQS